VRLGIFLTFFAVYLATMSRERPWGDANPVYAVAEGILREGTFAQPYRWPADAPPGRDGKYYAFNPLVNSLVHLPGAALREALLRQYPAEPKTPRVAEAKAQAEALSLPWASHLGPAALGALSCVLLFGLCLRLGLSRAMASATTLLAGLGCGIWVYSHYTYTDILQTAAFTGMLLALVRLTQERDGKSAAWLGAAAGALLAAKIVYAVALPGVIAVALWALRSEPRRIPRLLAAAALPFLAFVALIPYYNWARFGSPLDSGYNAYAGVHFARGSTWTGLWGLLLSPGKGVFLYNPPLVLAVFGWGTLQRRAPLVALALATSVVPVVLLNASSAFWHGDWAWGPRYLTFALPAFALPAGFVLERLAEGGRRLAPAGALVACLGLGIFVQTLGLAFYWDHWVRIADWDVKNQWLGQPNRAGSVLPTRHAAHGPHCDACFEDMYAHQWLPPLSPLLGHYWLLTTAGRNEEWETAQASAPWRRHTSMAMRSAYYGGPKGRIDWWPLDWGERARDVALIFALIAAAGVGGAWLWRRGVAASPDGPAEPPPPAPRTPAPASP
jgi:hypothetical protein